jgi:micrococcal nuclease
VRVTRVVDGDTVRISPAIDGINEVRLIGVDTPETKEPGCAVQPYGPEASEFATRELQGQEVDLEFDEEKTDRYDRLLAYVYREDEMFNEDLLEGGYAQVYIIAPNDEYEDRFEAAQAEAQAVPLGIWALSNTDQAQLTDRDNGIGTGDGCQPKAAPLPKAAPPPPAPPPPSTPDVPSAPASGGGGSYPPISQNSCPASAPIKGNQSGIYHVPSGQFYGRTNPEECFASESDAQAAGYRKSQR